MSHANAQGISFVAPSGVTSVASGTILTLTEVGQTSKVYIGSVPRYGDANYYTYNEGVTCTL